MVEGLKVNLISISQLCDIGLNVTFIKSECKAVGDHGNVRLEGQRSENNFYMWKPNNLCFSTLAETQAELWHRKLGHLIVRTMVKLSNQEVVRRLPKLRPEQNFVCGPCTKGKQVKVQHQIVPDVKSKKALELVYRDLMGPIQVESMTGKKYILVLVDDFTRYMWVRFLREKSETLESFRILALQLENEKWGIKIIRSDHDGKFQNELFDLFYNSHGIAHQYSALRTPEQNGVVERKNRTLQEMARAMMHGNNVAKHLWAEAVNTACYIINKVYVKKGTNMTPYELWKGKTPSVSYFHIFGCTYYILNDKDQLGKCDAKNDEGMFLGYSGTSTAFRVFNRRTHMVQKTVNVVFDDASYYIQVVQPIVSP
ncbi:Retrovirus-related Pol polyprotein from transposon TNT 1-94 [Cardamine amara subsp. amara]|uniref:Retrovirus-related Pol polyprotein from transposon TNT 1-94 n=1 Tax=Cardamine amara subsp. amara TaxID=228776 RepID=A0ABD0ZET6_CARAN